jgi:hypothetical protein
MRCIKHLTKPITVVQMKEVQSSKDLKQLNDAGVWTFEVMEKRPYRTK